MKTVAFYTLGCKLNYSESSTIGRIFSENGFQVTGFSDAADVYVINTCSVTENADKECRRIVRSALNVSPGAFIIIIGCYAQLKPTEIAKIEGVDLVLGASEKFKIPKYIKDLSKRENTEVHSCEIVDVSDFIPSFSHGNRTRSFLKVQDGCDYACTYCTIPFARGSSRSDTIANIVRTANEITQLGVKEIVLTGVNIGDFGNTKGENFLDLVRELDNVKGIQRFRISSIEPNLLTDEIIEFISASGKFVPHFHIPLQSGSDKILRSMKRRYLSNLYAERVSKIKSLMPHCCIGADVITGFPGETDTDFHTTCDFLDAIDVSYLHVFTYSERANTEAVKIKEVVPVNTRRERNKVLRALSVKKLRHFYEKHAGTEREVLFESENDNGLMYGFTDNYIKVKTPYSPRLVNQVKKVKLTAVDSDGIAMLNEISQEELLLTLN